jgi:hypothetical protein
MFEVTRGLGVPSPIGANATGGEDAGYRACRRKE